VALARIPSPDHAKLTAPSGACAKKSAPQTMVLVLASAHVRDIGEEVDERKRMRANQAHANTMGPLAFDGHRNAVNELLGQPQRLFDLVDATAVPIATVFQLPPGTNGEGHVVP
jgi:hypothetical protein